MQVGKYLSSLSPQHITDLTKNEQTKSEISDTWLGFPDGLILHNLTKTIFPPIYSYKSSCSKLNEHKIQTIKNLITHIRYVVKSDMFFYIDRKLNIKLII